MAPIPSIIALIKFVIPLTAFFNMLSPAES